MNEAEDFLRVAQREYKRGKEKENETKIRQSAEKAWNASFQATKALAAKMGKRIPRSYNAQIQFLSQIERENPDISNGYPFSVVFRAFASRLHGECFYHGDYVIDELDLDFGSVRRYIKVIKNLKHGSGSHAKSPKGGKLNLK